MTPQRNAILEKASTWIVFACEWCEHHAIYNHGNITNATDGAYGKGWRVIGSDLLCNQCAEKRNGRVRSELI